MKKFYLLLCLLTLMVVFVPATVMADYNPPTDTIDIPHFLSIDPCAVDAGLNAMTVSMSPSDPRGIIDCGDPCKSLYGSVGIVPKTIAFYGNNLQIVAVDDLLTVAKDDGCDEPKKAPKQVEEEEEEEKDEPQDSDGDGLLDRDDNCPLIANPDQADNFGTQAGDACEDTYTSNNEVLWGFIGKDVVGFYGFCDEQSVCQYIASVQPPLFHEQIENEALEDAGQYDPVLAGGKILQLIEGEPSRMTVLFVIGMDAEGNTIYQVNIYKMVEEEGAVFPYLVDDNFTVIVDEDGNWEWYDRIPN